MKIYNNICVQAANQRIKKATQKLVHVIKAAEMNVLFTFLHNNRPEEKYMGRIFLINVDALHNIWPH